MHLNRSFLFAPGNDSRKARNVFAVGADAAILDLEDAVALAEKPAARADVVAALDHPREIRAFVRINALDTGLTFGDLEEIVPASVDGIVLPKVESATDLAKVDWVIGELERRVHRAPGSVDLIPILETGPGIAAAREVAASSTRVKRLSFGAGDYTRDMGMEWTADEQECAHARAEIVLASRLAGLEPPIDTVWARLDDRAGLDASARRVRDMGFQGKFCIHPHQVGPVHAAFSPSETEVERARRIIAAFNTAEAEGRASIQVDGQFVDYPIVARARRVIAVATATAAHDDK